LGLCFLGVQILLPYPWKQLPRLFHWWPHEVLGERDDIVVCLRSSIMLKIILQREKTDIPLEAHEISDKISPL
jgi:hypothetical protein